SVLLAIAARRYPIHSHLMHRRATGGPKECSPATKALQCRQLRPNSLSLSARKEHGVARLSLALDFGAQGRRLGCRPAPLGTLLSPVTCSGTQKASLYQPPCGRRGGRRPERFPQLLPRGGP